MTFYKRRQKHTVVSFYCEQISILMRGNKHRALTDVSEPGYSFI